MFYEKEYRLRYQKERYQRLKQEHKCTWCNVQLPEDYNFTCCPTCRQKNNDRAAKRRENAKRAAIRGNGAVARKKQYCKGDKITSLDELAKQEYIYWKDKIVHNGCFMSWQSILAYNCIKRGEICRAEKVGESHNEN